MKHTTKKTIDLSKIDSMISKLYQNKIPYKVYKLSNIKGLGVNDIIPQLETRKYYTIRKLEYANIIIAEKFIRFNHCHLDDFLISYKFSKNEFPKNWTSIDTKCLN